MRTVNFGQLTIIGMVFDQGLCNMDWTASYLCYPELWSDYNGTCNYRTVGWLWSVIMGQWTTYSYIY